MNSIQHTPPQMMAPPSSSTIQNQGSITPNSASTISSAPQSYMPGISTFPSMPIPPVNMPMMFPSVPMPQVFMPMLCMPWMFSPWMLPPFMQSSIPTPTTVPSFSSNPPQQDVDAANMLLALSSSSSSVSSPAPSNQTTSENSKKRTLERDEIQTKKKAVSKKMAPLPHAHSAVANTSQNSDLFIYMNDLLEKMHNKPVSATSSSSTTVVQQTKKAAPETGTTQDDNDSFVYTDNLPEIMSAHSASANNSTTESSIEDSSNSEMPFVSTRFNDSFVYTDNLSEIMSAHPEKIVIKQKKSLKKPPVLGKRGKKSIATYLATTKFIEDCSKLGETPSQKQYNECLQRLGPDGSQYSRETTRKGKNLLLLLQGILQKEETLEQNLSPEECVAFLKKEGLTILNIENCLYSKISKKDFPDFVQTARIHKDGLLKLKIPTENVTMKNRVDYLKK